VSGVVRMLLIRAGHGREGSSERCSVYIVGSWPVGCRI
jgi:hypothetical protein